MKLTQDIQNLGNDMRAAFDARMNFLGENVQNTKKFIELCRRNRKAMAEHLHTDLETFTKNLKTTVKGLKAAFQQECQCRHNAFQKLWKEMQEHRSHTSANGHQCEKKSLGRILKSHKH